MKRIPKIKIDPLELVSTILCLEKNKNAEVSMGIRGVEWADDHATVTRNFTIANNADDKPQIEIVKFNLQYQSVIEKMEEAFELSLYERYQGFGDDLQRKLSDTHPTQCLQVVLRGFAEETRRGAGRSRESVGGNQRET